MVSSYVGRSSYFERKTATTLRMQFCAPHKQGNKNMTVIT